MTRIQSLLLGFGALLISTNTLRASDEIREPYLTTSQFAFHSDLLVNLNDALITTGTARNRGTSELFFEGAAKTCFEALPLPVRNGWNVAVDYYANVFSSGRWNDREQFVLRINLANVGRRGDSQHQQFIAVTRGILSSARSAYESCFWPQQNAKNHAWIDRLEIQLNNFEKPIAARLVEIYQTPWHGLPIQVDVVATAPPVGANSIYLSPAGGHVLASSDITDQYALEIIFHEASHTIAASGRRDPLPEALKAAANELGAELPRDLWHAALFYLTGQAVRHEVERYTGQSYIPYADARDLWSGSWAVYRSPIRAALQPYLNGKVNLSEATNALLSTIAAQ